MEAATEQRERADFVAGLRELADWYEQRDLPTPDLTINVWVEGRGELVEIARKIGPAEKDYEGSYFSLRRRFGPITLDFFTTREQVCRKVVKGTRHVPERVMPEYEEEIVEWVCDEPLMAAERPAHDDPRTLLEEKRRADARDALADGMETMREDRDGWS